MVVVGGDAEQLLPGPQHLVVCLGRVAVQAVQLAAVVVDLHRKRAFEPRIIVIILQRPVGVVVAAQETAGVHPGDKAVEGLQIAVLLGRLDGGKAAAGRGVGIVEIQVVGLDPLEAARRGEGPVQVGLIGGDGDKGVVHQLRVPAVVAVVGESHDGITTLLVLGLDLLFGPAAVRQDGMAVEVGLVELPGCGQKRTITHSVENSFCLL